MNVGPAVFFVRVDALRGRGPASVRRSTTHRYLSSTARQGRVGTLVREETDIVADGYAMLHAFKCITETHLYHGGAIGPWTPVIWAKVPGPH